MRRAHTIRLLTVLALFMTAASAAATTSVAAAASGPPPAFTPPVYGTMKAVGTVNARSLPAVHVGRASVPHTQAPSRALLLKRAGRTAIAAAAPAHPLQGTTGTALAKVRSADRRHGSSGLIGGSQALNGAVAARSDHRAQLDNAQAVGSNLELLNSFTGATHGNTGCCDPPDTQIAVSSSEEFELVNLTAFAFDRSGNDLGSFDITSLMAFGQANNAGSDPKVFYDPDTNRWFMTLMVCQNAACGGNFTTMGVDLAVSQTNDPLGGWLVYQNIFNGTPWNGLSFQDGNGPAQQIQDQPKLGFSNDKVTITDNVYQNNTDGTHCGAGSCFRYEFVSTWTKSELVTGSASYAGFSSGYAFDSIPALPTASASGDEAQYLVWQGFGSLGVNQITGTPTAGNLDNSNTQNPAIGGVTGTVAAYGSPDNGGNEVQSVAWQDNLLWAVFTDGCNPGGGTVDCTRVDEINTSNASSLTVPLDQDVGDANAFEIYPSITQDCVGDLHFGITYSNSADSTLPTATDISTTTPGGGYSRYEFLFGDTTYTGGRWGDYSSTVQDPYDCGNVWTAQEYGGDGSGGNWATGIGQFSWDTPFISSASPGNGPATGGTLVDIYGYDFVNGGTDVTFGGTPASVFFLSASHIEAISPAGTGGAVDIVATTANGSSTDFNGWSWVPTVTHVSPTAGPTGGGNPVDIQGAGFNSATSVSFGGTTASFSINNDGDITATAPSHSAGYVDVTVTGSTGTSAISSADRYKYDSLPTVTSLSPNAGPAAGGNTVTINGTGFVVSGLGAHFGSTASSSVTFVSSSQVRAVAPAHAHGTVDVRVTTPGGTSAASSGDKYAFGAPTVSSLSPNAGPTAGGNTVTINGTSLVPGSTVHFGTTTSSSVTFVSGTQLKAVAPAHSSGTVDVTVTTAAGTSATSSADKYAYDVRPAVSGVSPNAGPTGGGNTVTIAGTGFLSGAAVHFGSLTSSSVTFVSATQLKAIAPSHAAGTVDVTVTTPGGISATSAADKYAYGIPTVSTVNPTAGPTAGGNTVTINGSGFVSGASVHFGSTASSAVTFMSGTQLKAVAPAHAAGLVNVTVTTPAGTSAIVSGDRYTYDVRPAVSGLAPDSGSTAGGNTVTITGTGFLSGATVKFGTTLSGPVTFVSSTQLKAVAPAHSHGSVDVTVTTPGGTSASAAGDLYAYGAPTISSFTPSSGITGSTVTVTGTGYARGAVVKFGTLASTSVTIVSGTQLRAVVPNGAVPANISVSDSQGTATSVTAFTPTLSITGFSPGSGHTGTVVTINGRGFNGSSTVKFNGVTASSLTRVSSSQLKATVPSTATTGPITVTNTTAPAGTVRSAGGFTVT